MKMKKYISCALIASMVSSAMPITSFAASETITTTSQIIGANILKEGEGAVGLKPEWTAGETPASSKAPELHISVSNVAYLSSSDEDIIHEFTISLNNAEFKGQTSADGIVPATYADLTKEDFLSMITILDGNTTDETIPTISIKDGNFSKNEVTFTLTTSGDERTTNALTKDNKIVVDLATLMNRTSINAQATISVYSDTMNIDLEDVTFASIVEQGFSASIKKTDVIAEDEIVTISNPIKVKETVRNSFEPEIPESDDEKRQAGTEFTFKLSKGFAFVDPEDYTFTGIKGYPYNIKSDEFTVEIETFSDGTASTEFSIDDIEIEATSAKSGDTGIVRILSSGMDTVSLEIVEVVDYEVALTVDEDYAVPVMFNGVDSKNTGLTIRDDNNESLEITLQETFPGAWSMRDGFQFTLPEGIFVTDVDIIDVENFYQDNVELNATQFKNEMAKAYVYGEYEEFNFKRRTFDDVDHTLTNDRATVTFKLTLVAEPDFEGDVVFGFAGNLIDEQEVIIAHFIPPYEATADQNDVIIDYRNTALPTDIVIIEREAGLLAQGSKISFSVDRGDMIQFEKNATFGVSIDSDMQIRDETDVSKGTLALEIREESHSAHGVITISDIELFMQRSIPAGAYELTVSSSMEEAFLNQDLFGSGYLAGYDREDKVGDYDRYDNVVHQAFINVVSAGNDKDNTFTTKISVPIGEYYLIAGNKEVTLDVPAYINEKGYTMLPVRAVANALGVNTSNVLWNDETGSVTIMYGQRIITMKIGDNMIVINGSSVPASSAPEIKDERAFLPLRDLAIALGVSDIEWDELNQIATLNSNQNN